MRINIQLLPIRPDPGYLSTRSVGVIDQILKIEKEEKPGAGSRKQRKENKIAKTLSPQCPNPPSYLELTLTLALTLFFSSRQVLGEEGGER
jgi:hypothetical protein